VKARQLQLVQQVVANRPLKIKMMYNMKEELTQKNQQIKIPIMQEEVLPELTMLQSQQNQQKEQRKAD